MIFRVQDFGLDNLVTIHQVNRNALRTNAVLIITVIPILGYLDGSCRWRVGVGNREAILGITRYRRRVVGYTVFLNRVSDRLAVFINGQLIKGCTPVIFRIQDLGLNNLVTIHQVNRNALWTKTVLIVAVIPTLSNLDGSRRWCVGVGNRKAILGITRYRRRVISYSLFFNRVRNRMAGLVYQQVIKGGCPIVAFIQHSVLVSLITVGEEMNRNARRTKTILIIVVIPILSYLDGSCRWLVGVGNGKAILGITSCCRRVISYTVFCNRVRNRMAGLVYRQVIKGSRPIVAFIQHSVLVSLITVGEEMNRNALWTKAVLVVVVIPTLGYLDGSRCRLVGVGNDKAILGVTRYRRRVVGYSLFCNRVRNRMAVLAYRQIIKSGCPIVALTQLFGLPILTTVD